MKAKKLGLLTLVVVFGVSQVHNASGSGKGLSPQVVFAAGGTVAVLTLVNLASNIYLHSRVKQEQAKTAKLQAALAQYTDPKMLQAIATLRQPGVQKNLDLIGNSALPKTLDAMSDADFQKHLRLATSSEVQRVVQEIAKAAHNLKVLAVDHPALVALNTKLNVVVQELNTRGAHLLAQLQNSNAAILAAYSADIAALRGAVNKLEEFARHHTHPGLSADIARVREKFDEAKRSHDALVERVASLERRVTKIEGQSQPAQDNTALVAQVTGLSNGLKSVEKGLAALKTAQENTAGDVTKIKEQMVPQPAAKPA
ncbi:MAG TPA: hypothetical protein VLG71_02145 [Candidatus Limnocylindria bacterium]|nr:hypothetical protein [Candidatus Limnocylindria bacterium]